MNRDDEETIDFKKSNWHKFMSLIAYFISSCIILWLDKDTVMKIIDLSCGHIIVYLLIFPPILFWFIERFSFFITGKRMEDYYVIIRVFIILMFLTMYSGIFYEIWDYQKENINKKRVGPQKAFISQVAGFETKGSKAYTYYILTHCNGKIHEIRLDYNEYKKYNKDDTIIVTYNTGCLDKDIYNSIEIIKGTKLSVTDTIELWKGHNLSPEEADRLRKEMR